MRAYIGNNNPHHHTRKNNRHIQMNGTARTYENGHECNQVSYFAASNTQHPN